MTPDERQLVLRLRSGEVEALGQLFDLHHLRVYRTALAVARDPAAAEDIMQDAFLRLHKRQAHMTRLFERRYSAIAEE